MPAGPGTLEVAAFTGNFAPAASVTARCATRVAGQGQNCRANTTADQSFGSDPLALSLIEGVRNQAVIEVFSLPFVIEQDPEPGAAAAEAQPTVTYTVVDAAHPIDTNIATSFLAGGTTGATTVSAVACDERPGAGGPDCSSGGDLDVQGLRVTARANAIVPAGAATVRVVARNTATPARQVDARYGITVPEPPVTTTLGPSTTTSLVPDTTTTTSTTSGPSSTTTLPPDTTTTSTTSTSSTTSTTSTTVSTTSSTSTSSTTTTSSSTTTSTMVPLHCVTFRLANAVEIAGLSFNADYSAAGGEFLGSGDSVSCRNLVADSVAAFRDNDAGASLGVAFASATAFAGPVDLATCDFQALTPPATSDFTIEVVEAVGPELNTVTADVVVSDVACP